MKIERSSGLLMHITSLPGKHGIGTMGQEAYQFVDLLAEGGQKFWQILPTGPVSSIFGYSPYSSLSSFAGNYLFINLAMLQKEEWMRNYIMSELPQDHYNDFVDFQKIISFKLPLLKNLAANFFKYADAETKRQYEGFCEDAGHWLEDYSIFMAVGEHYNNFNWSTWENGIRLREPAAIKTWAEKLKTNVDFHKFLQFVFSRQWSALKKYANERGVRIIGDIPIYVTFDSAETWASPDIFQLNERTLQPLKVAGVPPDYFSKTGQRWGNPLYRWHENGEIKEETLNWWATRFDHGCKLFDIIRIDHFKGFESYWSIPAIEETAVNGQWDQGPGIAFFKKLKQKLAKKCNDLPLIAEDLGVITPEVEKLRDELGLPGMKVLQFAFDFNNKNAYLPHNYKNTNCVVYTGTHDNNTTNGWFYENENTEETRSYIMRYLRLDHRHEFHWKFVNKALSSIADLAIFPTQDILGYAGKFRMNTPGKIRNNWAWKLTPDRLTPEIMQKLKAMCQLYNRI
ncbi:MAG: 4-alpha-glucanotransferase [bacterium]|nr:4-alpha-glucanotransferase [bacterium]